MSRTTLFRSLFALLAVALMAAAPVSAVAKNGRHHSKHAKKAHRADRNRDGLPDRWERHHKLSLAVNQAPRDQDRDGSNNAAEYAAHTNPRKPDSDDDGVKDGSENAGTVVSFTDGVLVISSGGVPVSGKVTSGTEIRCGVCGRDGDGHHGDGDRQGDDDFPGAHASHDGRGENESGDDHGTDGGLPSWHHTAGGMPSGGGLPTGGGMPTSGGLPGTPKRVCSVADLKPGTIVREAELKLTAGGAVWDEIKIVPATT